LPGLFGEGGFVAEHGAGTREFVGENGGVRPGDATERGHEGGAMGIEKDHAPPVAPRWFLKPVALEQVVEEDPGFFPQVGGGEGGAIVIVLEFKARVVLEGVGDDGEGGFAGKAIGMFAGGQVEGIEHIGIEGGIASGEHTKEGSTPGFPEEGGGEVFFHGRAQSSRPGRSVPADCENGACRRPGGGV